mgnify:CR=1 FL=1
MGGSGRQQEGTPVVGGQLDPDPFQPGRRSMAQIDRNIELGGAIQELYLSG